MAELQKHSQDFVRILKIDEEKQIVYGEVYAPYIVDTHGDMMMPEDVELMAHRFMALAHVKASIDTNHDQTPNGSHPVESFIARKGDPDYTEGAWVLGVKVLDIQIWKAIKEGRLNGYSMQSWVKKKPVAVEIEYQPTNLGYTEVGGDDNHTHVFYAELDDSGRVKSGVTSKTNNHEHKITKGTATEISDGHSHRFFI